jgi:hypothetical protein
VRAIPELTDTKLTDSTFASSFLNAEPQSFRELYRNSWSAQRVAEATCKARKGRRSHSANSANALAFLSKLSNTFMLCVFAFNYRFAKVELTDHDSLSFLALQATKVSAAWLQELLRMALPSLQG